MKDYSIREVTEEDLPKLSKLESLHQVSPWSLESFSAEMHKPYSHLLVMTDDETDQVIAGYLCYRSFEESFEVLNLLVDPAFRKQGVAVKLMQKVIKHALKSEVSVVILEVRKSNLAAISFYQKCGFMTSKIRKGFYSNGEDAYHMNLDLKNDDVFQKMKDF